VALIERALDAERFELAKRLLALPLAVTTRRESTFSIVLRQRNETSLLSLLRAAAADDEPSVDDGRLESRGVLGG